MKTKFWIPCITLAAGLFAGLASASAGTPATGGEMSAGSYTEAKITKEITTAAMFAVQAQSTASHQTIKLVKVLRALTQVVAGTNY